MVRLVGEMQLAPGAPPVGVCGLLTALNRARTLSALEPVRLVRLVRRNVYNIVRFGRKLW